MQRDGQTFSPSLDVRLLTRPGPEECVYPVCGGSLAKLLNLPRGEKSLRDPFLRHLRSNPFEIDPDAAAPRHGEEGEVAGVREVELDVQTEVPIERWLAIRAVSDSYAIGFYPEISGQDGTERPPRHDEVLSIGSET